MPAVVAPAIAAFPGVSEESVADPIGVQAGNDTSGKNPDNTAAIFDRRPTHYSGTPDPLNTRQIAVVTELEWSAYR
jgi:hypothetical protein